MHIVRLIVAVTIISCLFNCFTMLSAFHRLHSSSLVRRVGCRSPVSFPLNAVRPLSHMQVKTVRKDKGEQSDSNRYCITTPIYYVNGEPHLGHAYTSVVSDIIARYHRKDGKDVFFLSGTDEHGQKVAQSACQSHKTPIVFADDVSAKFRNLMSLLHCSNDDFIRTTEDRHKKAVEHLWKVLEENDQIYLGAYEGWYSIRDEAFYQESELVNGKAPTGADVAWVKEESYFFRLSQWTEKLTQLYRENPDFIGPRSRRNEVLGFLTHDGGLKDLSISRTTFTWGVPVPGNPKHVVYVWLDALVNYISALGYPDISDERFQKYWPADVHIVGKDILRFHTIYWPAFLLAANLPIPKRIYAHGWWTKDGEKMSKSLGNVLDPFTLVKQYGVDYVRYFLASEIHFGNDGDFSHQSFAAKINSELANDYGNLVMRVLVLIHRNCQGKVPQPGTPLTPEDEALLTLAKTQTLSMIRSQLKDLNIKSVVDIVMALAKEGNRYINQQAPWELAKTNPAKMHTVLFVLYELLRITTIYLEPVIPTSASHVLDEMGVPASMRDFASVSENIASGWPLTSKPTPLFPRIELPPVDDISSQKIKNININSTKTQKNMGASIGETACMEKYSAINNDIGKLKETIIRVGNDIREKKARQVCKEELVPLIGELKFLKDRYKLANNGVDYAPQQST